MLVGRRRSRRVTHGERAEVKVQQRHEHEHQQDAAAQLQQVFGGTLVAEGGNAGKDAAGLAATLGQQEEQSTAQGQVPVGQASRRRQFPVCTARKLCIFIFAQEGFFSLTLELKVFILVSQRCSIAITYCITKSAKSTANRLKTSTCEGGIVSPASDTGRSLNRRRGSAVLFFTAA